MKVHQEKLSYFITLSGKIISAGLGTLIIYAASYYLIKAAKPVFLLHNDRMKQAYQTIYRPIRKLDATKPAHLEQIEQETKFIFNGCNYFGDKIFFEYDGKGYALYTLSEDVRKKVLSMKAGDDVNIHIGYILGMDDSFNNVLYPHVNKIDKVIIEKAN